MNQQINPQGEKSDEKMSIKLFKAVMTRFANGQQVTQRGLCSDMEMSHSTLSYHVRQFRKQSKTQTQNKD